MSSCCRLMAKLLITTIYRPGDSLSKLVFFAPMTRNDLFNLAGPMALGYKPSRILTSLL